MKLLIDPTNQEYYVLHTPNGAHYFYKVLSWKPIVLRSIIEFDNPVLANKKLVEKEMEEFALKEFKKLKGYWE